MPQHRERLYGLTDAGYQRLLGEQQGVCAICLGTDSRSLAVDHDHSREAPVRTLCAPSMPGLASSRGCQNSQVTHTTLTPKSSQTERGVASHAGCETH